MKHLHIVSAKVWGGGEQYVYNICKEEKLRGNETFVVVDKNQIQMAERFAAVAEVIRANLRSTMGVRALGVVNNLVRQKNIDTIGCHSGNVGLLAGLAKALNNNVKLFIYRHNVTPNKKDYYHKWLQKKTDAFICVSNVVYNLQVNTADSRYKDKFHLVYSGIDTQRFPECGVNRHGFGDNTILIGYAGRLTENKGILILLKAVKLLLDNNVDVKLAISGPFEKGFEHVLENSVADLKLQNNVELLGLNKDMNSFYRGLDVFVLPSLVKEAFGLVLCEAMYCRVPVITTNSGAQEEIINNGINGLIVKPNDVQALAKALQFLVSNKSIREKLAINGHNTVVRRFTINRCVDKLESLIKHKDMGKIDK